MPICQWDSLPFLYYMYVIYKVIFSIKEVLMMSIYTPGDFELEMILSSARTLLKCIYGSLGHDLQCFLLNKPTKTGLKLSKSAICGCYSQDSSQPTEVCALTMHPTAHENLSILKILNTVSNGESSKMTIFHSFDNNSQKAQVPQLHKKSWKTRKTIIFYYFLVKGYCSKRNSFWFFEQKIENVNLHC